MKIEFCKEFSLTDFVYLTRVDGKLVEGSISGFEDTARKDFNRILANRGKLPDDQNIVLETHIIPDLLESDTKEPEFSVDNQTVATP